MNVSLHCLRILSGILIISVHLSQRFTTAYPASGVSPQENDSLVAVNEMEMEVTTEELPTTSERTTQPPENDVENAATEIEIIVETESSISTSKDSSFNEDGVTLAITTLPTPANVEITEDENTAAEEVNQTTKNENETRIIDDYIIEHPDKKDILNELQNIWYYTEELGEDQNELKSSLSSLVHMTYARVYDQSDETLERLKFLLRRLRARLLDQSDDVSEPNSNLKPATKGNDGDLNTSKDSDSEMKITKGNGTLSEQPIAISSEAKNIEQRSKRSISGNSQKELNESIIFQSVDPDENSLFLKDDDSKDKLSYFHVKDGDNISVPKIPMKTQSQSEEGIVRGLIDASNSNALDGDGDDFDSTNFVHVTIFQPDKKNNSITTIPSFSSSQTMGSSLHSSHFPFSKFSTAKKHVKPNSNTKYEYISQANVMKLKNKYSTSTTPKPTTTEESIVTSWNSSPTIEDVIQNIIDVLKTPIQRPTSSSSQEIKNPVASLSWLFDSPFGNANNETLENDGYLSLNESFLQLPSYLTNIINSPFEVPTTENSKNYSTKLGSPAETPVVSDTSSNEVVIMTPSNVFNGTFERVQSMVNTFTSLTSAARFILLFSILLSIVSIMAGLIGLGPSPVGIGVLGFIVPVLIIFALSSGKNGKKKKAKIDILNNLRIEDFTQALDMISEAILKYDKSYK